VTVGGVSTGAVGALDPHVGAVAAAMAWALPGCHGTDVPPGDGDRFLAAVAHQRVSGLVLEAVDAGALAGWPDGLRPPLVETHLGALRTSLAAEAAGVRVADLFRAASIPFAVLKGCATAHLDYADPALRVTGDVDVLIARPDLATALAVLDRAGLSRSVPPFRAGWEQRYGKDLIVMGDDGIEIDLHLGLVSGYFGVVMPTQPLLERLVHYEVAGRSMPALDPLGRLLHACIHTAASTPIRLGSAADVVQIAGGDGAEVADLPEYADGLGVAGLVAQGLARAWNAFGAEPTALSAWADAYRPSPVEERALAAFTSTAGEARWWSGAAALPIRKRPGYVLPLLVPSRAHLRSRNRTYRDHVRISARRLAPRRGGHQ
jgi:hypothetical protein